jgi:uncharacterized protein YjbI with pentapeptide repeats
MPRVSGRHVAGIVVALVVAVPGHAARAAPAVGQQTTAQLEQEKLRAEIRKLKDDSGGAADFARVAPAITALVAVVGALATLWRQLGESSRQRTLDRQQRERERIQRFDEQFGKMVENLGSDSNATRAAASAQIATFLRPEYGEFHEQVFMLLVATLRFPRQDVSDRILARAFQRVAPGQIGHLREADPAIQLDLSRCYLARIDMSGVDLHEADIAFADLHGTVLRGCNLRRLRGFKVNLDSARLTDTDLQEARLAKATLKRTQFHRARLVSANLKEVDATGASFQGARLQEAHFEGAVLSGARFEDADLNNAFFGTARLDSSTCRSIARGAQNWRKANFDPDVRLSLEQLSGEQGEK